MKKKRTQTNLANFGGKDLKKRGKNEEILSQKKRSPPTSRNRKPNPSTIPQNRKRVLRKRRSDQIHRLPGRRRGEKKRNIVKEKRSLKKKRIIILIKHETTKEHRER